MTNIFVGNGAQPRDRHRDQTAPEGGFDRLTDQISDREPYMKGVNASYTYESYNTYKASEIRDK